MEDETIDVYRVAVERYFDKAGRTWKVNRVRFETNQGLVIYRPSKLRGLFRDIGGKKLCFEHREMISPDELHPAILDISNAAIEQGICKVKAKFKALRREGKTYQYFQAEDIESMEIVPIERKA